MKIGVLGGTFDPVHRGHIAMAEEAVKSLGLSEVLLVPAGQPMSKSDGRITPAKHRIRLLNLAAAGKPYLKVSSMEIERPGPSYTVDTIAAIKKQYGDKTEIYFILGWDSLAQIGDWREPKRIVEMCYLVAVPRPGWPRPNIDLLEKDIPGITKKVVFMDKPRLDISASAIREMAGRGESIDHLVTREVEEYIKKHKLYTG